MLDVDFILPYVDNTKEIWRQNYIKFCQDNNRFDILHRIDTERYDDFGLLKYIFKGVDKFMPWIRKVHLIVQDETQVPDWLDKTKINVVIHNDFIPQEYLPTYNSCTIEMFLWNIPDLAEHFIYANDDIYITRMLNIEDFFGKASYPLLALKRDSLTIPSIMFNQVCHNCWRDVSKLLNYPWQNENEFIMPQHGLNPLLKSHCLECFNKLKYKIINNISATRTCFNHNQYLFTDYALCKKEYGISNRDFTYIRMDNNILPIKQAIESKNFQYICLNDSGITDRKYFHENINQLEEAFMNIGLDNKSKFEV